MNIFRTNKIFAILIILTLSLSLSLSACKGIGTPPTSEPAVVSSDTGDEPTSPTAEPVSPAQPASAKPVDSPETNAKYLDYYYNINLPAAITHKNFTDAITATGAFEMFIENDGDDALAFSDAVKYAVIGARMEELALLYTAEEIDGVLSANGLSDTDYIIAPYLAHAIKSGLITSEQVRLATADAAIDRDTANALILAVATETGVARSFFAYTTDTDFAQKLNNTWETFEILDDDVLLNIGTQSVMNKITTGFNLRKSDYDSHFLPEYTLRYGHSSIEHAQQLVALLASKNIVAKVQLEPKTSIYEYMPDWGDPGEPSDTYKVEKINDNLMLAYASEYDLVFEFATKEDKDSFDDIINTYAKKNSGEEGKALLRDSWWQPLYVSHVEMGEGYELIYDQVITHGKYSLHPFSVPSAKDDTAAKLSAIDTSIEVVPEQLWCNEAFFRYLNGESE